MADQDDSPTATAERLIDKLRVFATGLEPAERELLAALLAPGITAAWQPDDDVEGFSVSWSPDQLPRHLAEAIRGRQLRVEGW